MAAKKPMKSNPFGKPETKANERKEMKMAGSKSAYGRMEKKYEAGRHKGSK